MLKKQKEELVRNMTESFGSAELMVVTRHSGLTVAEMTDLRRRMRAAGVTFRVTKNRLAKRALEKDLLRRYPAPVLRPDGGRVLGRPGGGGQGGRRLCQ